MEHQSVNKPNTKGIITRLYLVAFLFLGIVTFFMLYTRENEIQLTESEFWFDHSDVGDIMRLVTESLC